MGSDEIPLISGDRYAEYGYLSPKTGTVRVLAGDPLQSNLAFQGVFGHMDIGFVALYRGAGELYVQSEQFRLRLDSKLTASVTRGPGNARTLQIVRGTENSLVVTYIATPRWDSKSAELADFTWTEEEDFDFGLRIASVINDERRFASFYAD